MTPFTTVTSVAAPLPDADIDLIRNEHGGAVSAFEARQRQAQPWLHGQPQPEH